MRKLVTLTLCAALPLAGFAFSSAHAQDDMSYAAAPVAPVYGSAPPQPSYYGQQPTPVSSAAADMTRMSQLEQQVRDLTNQVEQKDFQLRQLQESFDRYVADTNMRLQDIEGRGGAAAPRPAATETFDSPASDAPAPSASPSMPPQPSAPTPSGSTVPGTLSDPDAPYSPSATPPLGQMSQNSGITPNADGTITSGRGQPSGGNAAQAYDQAFGYLQQSNYTDAENAFRNFLATYPTHPLAANAQYWLGETYFAQTQYSTAAKTFAKAFQDYPKGQKAPDALLKLSLTLEKMNKKSDACLTLKELKKRFPSGPASVLRRGDEEAIRMNCPA